MICFDVAEPPTWLTAPADETKVAEGSPAMIHCHTFGAPKPVITWTKDDRPIPYRFEVLDNGTLSIRVGTAQCLLSNTRMVCGNVIRL